ncbi:hypothetical protein [Pontibacter sp. HJ8]
MKSLLLLIVLVAALSFAVKKTIDSRALLAERTQEKPANIADDTVVEPRMVVMR